MQWIFAAINGILLDVVNVRAFNYYQLNGYRFEGVAKLRRLARKQVAYGVVNALVCYFVYLVSIVRGARYGAAFYALFCILGAAWFYYDVKDKRARTPLRFTKRCARFAVVHTLVAAALSEALCAAGAFVDINGVSFGIAFMPASYILSPALFALTAAITHPIEQAVARIYTEGCKKALDAKTDLVRIGVTGSYGKTGVKNILAAFLSEKYRVYATPESYNTPMGICISVRDMPGDAEFFIAEMGAKRKGDVSLLCDIVKPVCAVITGIAAQHLATFGTVENVIRTKAELSDYAAHNGGKSFFNTDNEYCARMYEENVGEKYRAGKGGDFYAKDVRADKEGSSFSLCFPGGEEICCSTRLIGLHNVSNIVLAAAVAYSYGVSPQEIAAAAKKLRPVPHRLELIGSETGVTVIDDGYNSNEEGTKAALGALAMFDGRKIVACQGLAEMGERENAANFALGERIAAVADIAVLIGPYAEAMKDGALSSGMRIRDVYVRKNLCEAQELFATILRRGDVLLIENDLPDNF